jgi:tetratricopeptide (TPR) repeat protein
MRLTLRVLAIAAFMSGALSPARTARAEAPTNEERALSLFKESQTAYRDARFDESLRLLDEAYALRAEPVLLYNMARVHETMGNLDRAIATYERYLAEATDVPDRPALEARVANLKTMREDRARRATTPPPRREAAPIAPWIVLGAGGLVLAGGGVFGLVASDRESAARNEAIQRDAVQAHDDAKTYATVANVGFVVGGALALTGLVWVIWANVTRAPRSASATPFTF